MDQKIALFAIGGWSHLNLIPEGFGLFFSPKAFDGGEGGAVKGVLNNVGKKCALLLNIWLKLFVNFMPLP